MEHTYTPYWAEICRARATSGCPCANAGFLLRGCGNSVDANGARLVAGGIAAGSSASIAADVLTLDGTGMPDGPALYFQGTDFRYAQLPFGDGLLCVEGPLTRLGVLFNAPGATSYPGAGQPSVSAAGGVSSPGLRSYQIWYRDAAAFCTSATFNISSGIALTWAP